MSDIVAKAVEVLSARLDGGFEGGSVKFDLGDAGAVRIDETGVSADDSAADCTLTAEPETFQDILEGNINPTSAFMTGQLKVEGDMGLAMKLGSVLS